MASVIGRTVEQQIKYRELYSISLKCMILNVT